MTDKKLIELFRSGNFTLIYCNQGDLQVYKGKHDIDKLPKKEVHEFYGADDFEGYLPEIVKLLTEALGGKSDSF